MPVDAASAAASVAGKSPVMFSTSPRIGAPVRAATVIDFLTTRCETSEGIVTITVPESFGTIAATVARRSVPGLGWERDRLRHEDPDFAHRSR